MNRHEYKEALGKLDKSTRVCFLYLEKLILDKFKVVLGSQQTPAPKVNLKKLESKMDSLQKQLDGLRPKIEAGYKLSQEHYDQETYLKKLADKNMKVIDEMQIHFEELYKSGYYKEGQRRKIRDEGLISLKRDEK